MERRPDHTWLLRILGLTDLLSLRTHVRIFGTSTRDDYCRPGDLDVRFSDFGIQRLPAAVAVSQRRVDVSNSASHGQSANPGGDWWRNDDLVAGECPTTGSPAADSSLVDVMDMGRRAKIRGPSNMAHGVGMCDRLVAELLHLYSSHAFHDDRVGGDGVDSLFGISKTIRRQNIQGFLYLNGSKKIYEIYLVFLFCIMQNFASER